MSVFSMKQAFTYLSLLAVLLHRVSNNYLDEKKYTHKIFIDVYFSQCETKSFHVFIIIVIIILFGFIFDS